MLPLLAAVLVLAQTPDSTRDTSVTLKPVVVQAARSDKDVTRLPLAITRVAPRSFAGGAGRGLDEGLALVPGVLAQSRAGGTDVRITIRGYGARGAGDRSNSGTTRGIRILLDGFPETEPDGRTALDGIDLASTHSIEVVRSNASALWGNAAGGVVNVSSVPGAGTRALDAEVATGSFGLWRGVVRGSTSAGSGDLGFSLVRTTFGGWRQNSASRRTLVNMAYRSDEEEATRVGVYAVASDNFFEIPGPQTATQFNTNDQLANPTYLLHHERRHNRVGRLGVTLAHDLSERFGLDGLFFVQPKFLQRSERNTFRDFTRYHLGAQGGLRLTTPLGQRVAGELRAGFDAAYQDGAALFYPLDSAGNRGGPASSNQREAARNVGVYLQEELAAGRWSVTVGARFDDVTYVAEDYIDELSDRKSFQHISPKLGATYSFGPFHSLYAAVGGGIEAPAGNETDPPGTFGQDTIFAINPLLDAIRSTTFELGTRQRMGVGGLVRELSYDVALYDTEVRDEIIPYRGGRFYFSAGKVRRAGVEVGIGAQLSGGLSFSGALTYSHHRYREYLVDSVHYDTAKAGGVYADYGGNEVVGVPAVSYTVSGEAAPPFARPLWLRVTVQGNSRYFADDANQIEVSGYKIVNVSLGTDRPLRVAGVGVSGFVAVNNLFDRPYLASAFLNPDAPGGVPVAFEGGLPRNFVLGLTLGGRHDL